MDAGTELHARVRANSQSVAPSRSVVPAPAPQAIIYAGSPQLSGSLDLYGGLQDNIEDLGNDMKFIIKNFNEANRRMTDAEDSKELDDLNKNIDDVIAETENFEEKVEDGVVQQFPGLGTSIHILSGRPADALVQASASADLVVVGTRGHGGFRGLLMGSVSQAVLVDAACPVMVVPNRAQAEEG